MKYRVTFKIEKTYSVEVESDDKSIINEFKKLGNINSTNDFIKDDVRWKIEQSGYDAYSSLDESLEESEEEIVDRYIICL